MQMAAAGELDDPLINSRDAGEVDGEAAAGILSSSSCPGCKAAHFSSKGAPPPYKPLFYLALLVFSTSLPISSVFPFLYFMVKDFGIAQNNADIGYYVGFVGSAFMVGRFLTSLAWGSAADTYGRRLVMFAGVISDIIFNTMFGFCSSFWMAVASRFLLGSFNGMLGPVRAYASEICSDEHQALGLSVAGTSWGLGLVVGPALGGYLAQPAIKYPTIFANTIFEIFPYLLPCVCTSAFAVVALATTFGLPETLHKHNVNGANRLSQAALPSKISVDVVDGEGQINKKNSVNDDLEPRISRKSEPTSTLWRNWGLMASIVVYCVWSLHDMAYTEIFSLWAVSPRASGGLSFTSSDLGIVLSISGFSMLIFQPVVFPPLARSLGPILLARLSAFLSIPVLAAYTLIARLENPTLLWASVVSTSVAKNIFACTIATASFMLINNSVPKEQRGAANGLSLSLMSLFKALGPAGGGSLFAWTQTRLDASFLPGDSMVFFILNIFALLTALATFEPFLSRSLDKPPTARLSDLVQR